MPDWQSLHIVGIAAVTCEIGHCKEAVENPWPSYCSACTTPSGDTSSPSFPVSHTLLKVVTATTSSTAKAAAEAAFTKTAISRRLAGCRRKVAALPLDEARRL